MNIFRLAGDMTHLISIVVLLLKIHTIRSCRGAAIRLAVSAIAHRHLCLSCAPSPAWLVWVPALMHLLPCPAGISLKTQELYALVFVCRYLDLFMRYVSLCAPPDMQELVCVCDTKAL